MRKAIGILAGSALYLLASAASAEPVTCQSLADGLLKGAVTPQTKVDSDANGCTFRDLQVHLGSRTIGWSIDRLRIDGPDFRALGHDRPLPSSLWVVAHGIRMTPQTPSSHARYLMSVMQRPFNARLHFGWDQASGRLDLQDLTLESDRLGRISLGLAADLPGPVPNPDALAIRQVRLVLDNRAIVESMLVPAIVGMVAADKDPAEAIPTKQKHIERMLRWVPGSMIDDASRDALIAFIRDFPHPTGHFETTIDFETPLTLGHAPLDAIRRGGNPAWLKHAHVQVRYEPQPPAPDPYDIPAP